MNTDKYHYIALYVWEHKKGLKYKLIELYDKNNDPFEKSNIAYEKDEAKIK
mgnify:CR=1 FL=1